MRTVLLAFFALFLSQSASAAAPSALPAGTYAFGNEFKVISKLEFHVIYGFTDAGRAELAQREGAGEQCSYKERDIYLCKKFGSLDGAANEVRDRVVSQLGGQFLMLEAPRGEPSLITHGEVMDEFEVPQAATYLGKSHDSYRLVNVQGNWSVRLDDSGTTQFDLENGVPCLARPLAVTHSRESFDTYLVLALFKLRTSAVLP